MARVALAILAASLLMGCSQHRGLSDAVAEHDAQPEFLVGSWTTNRGFVPLVRTFHADGTYVESAMNQTLVTGRWELIGNRLNWITERGKQSARVANIDETEITLVFDHELPLAADGDDRTRKLQAVPLTSGCS